MKKESNANVKKAYELSLKKTKSDFEQTKITSSAESAAYARQFYHEDLTIYESSFIMLLNGANSVIGWVKIGQGGVSTTSVDIKLICKYAIESLAVAVVLVHNHPSGNKKPSTIDERLTKDLRSSLELFQCKLLDHIILTEDEYYSFVDNGML